MRQTKFRPSFDTMDRRITPSDPGLAGIGGAPAGVDQISRPSPELSWPGEDDNVVANLDNWVVAGPPPEPPLPGEDDNVVAALDNWYLAGGRPKPAATAANPPLVTTPEVTACTPASVFNP